MDSLARPKRLPRAWGDLRRDWPLLAALSPLLLSLGLTYWRVPERDDRQRRQTQNRAASRPS